MNHDSSTKYGDFRKEVWKFESDWQQQSDWDITVT